MGGITLHSYKADKVMMILGHTLQKQTLENIHICSIVTSAVYNDI